MILYADILFFFNAVVDYLLLLLSARAAGAPLRRKRFALGAALGGLYAVMIFAPGFSFLNRGRYKVLSAVLMLLTAYGATKAAIKQSAIFFALTCALGGGVMAIGMMDGASMSLGRGVVYSIPDVKIILLSGTGCYAVMSLILPKLCRHTAAGGELCSVRLGLMGRSVVLTALWDTGNTLNDPVTGQGVPVAEGEAILPMFPAEYRPKLGDLRDPVPALERLNREEWAGRFRILPYRAVGVERGFLLAVKLDWIAVGDRRREGALVALSPTPVSDGGGYKVLMGEW
ncbi:MAG: sigma-E processing peptidase SpoIIGA [Ruminococcaceae bacterium]|nr:sigma-E processing peptidase SpoIIGA [Oscillospiraceae bacterium]